MDKTLGSGSMKTLFRIGAAVVALGLWSPASAATPSRDPTVQGPVQCDRACLQSAVDQVLAAMIAHDASKAPLGPDVRYTENGQTLALNDGFWNTVSGRGKYSHYFLDTRTNQAGFMGVVKEGPQTVVLGMRIALQGKRISEIETIMARQGRGWSGPNSWATLEEMGKPDAIWLQDVPAGERASREDMIRISDMYFSALENNDGKGDYSFLADDCYRLENGFPTTAGPHKAVRPAAAAAPLAATEPRPSRSGPDIFNLTCRKALETGFHRQDTRIRDRRYSLIDEEKGAVFSFVFFDHAGTVHNYKLTDGTLVAGDITSPGTWEIVEAFRLDKGKIKTIEAVLTNSPYGMKAGWDGH